MEGTLQRLREFQGEKVAYGYLSQFSSPARGRALSGLGQVGFFVLARFGNAFQYNNLLRVPLAE